MGGGSGGHVTPVLAVIDELAKRHSDIEVRFWCDRAYKKQSQNIMKRSEAEVKVEVIRAGKFRRYHGTSLTKQLTDIPTLFHNALDLFLVLLGFLQSFFKLVFWRPKVVFLKGGFVCLPVGWAAHILRIPIVIHDSDVHPGLTNRLLAKYAQRIGTGAPLEYYSYPSDKASYVGVPVSEEFRVYDDKEKQHAKTLFHLPPDRPLVVVVGGGLGAKRINDAMVVIGTEILKYASVVHVSGVGQYEALRSKVPQNQSYKLYSFLSDHMARLLGAADVLVTRAGASAMAEAAQAGASTIIVPNKFLVGGHQSKNAQVYTDAGAATLADEDAFSKDPTLLQRQILDLIQDKDKRHELSGKLQQFAKPNAAFDVASLIERAGEL